MIAERFPELAKLSEEDKRLLVSELCEDLTEQNGKPDPRIVEELESRWKRFESDPSGSVTLEEFRRRIGK